MVNDKDERREAEQIIKLGIMITAHKASYPISERAEYLRGWERALQWVMHQEDPPTEFLTEEFTKRTGVLTTSTDGSGRTSTTTTLTVTVRRINKAQVSFHCPKCGKENIHGWPEGEDRSGHRTSHCACWPQGYYIEM